MGPPGVLLLGTPFGARWEAGEWWHGGHECAEPFAAAPVAAARLRATMAERGRSLGGADLVLGHGIAFRPGGLDRRAPGDRFVTYRPAEQAESVATFVGRLVARGRAARRLTREPFAPEQVDAIAALVDPSTAPD